jgi:hypothetical protein
MLVDERTAQTNRIRDSLKLYFPQVLGWFERVDLPTSPMPASRWNRAKIRSSIRAWQ